MFFLRNYKDDIGGRARHSPVKYCTMANNWIGKDKMGPVINPLLKLKTELIVFNASFLNTSTMKAMLKTLIDSSGQDIFPTVMEMIRT